MRNDFRRRRLARLVRGLALLLLATFVFVVPPGGTPGARAASRTPQPSTSRRSTAVPPGTIAYTRNYSELHLVQPDATGDQVIWTEPSGAGGSLLQSAWRPDSAEIAFASTHEQAVSLYQSDLYGVRPDGSGLRRITNPPEVSQLGGYPTGTVVVTVSDDDLAAAGPYYVYMEGAPQLQVVPSLSSGSSATLTFTDVAALPNATQYPVVIYGLSRWIYAPSGVVVQAGGTVTANVTIASSTNLESWGAHDPVWRTDGAQVDFALGSLDIGGSMPAYPSPGALAGLLLASPASASTHSFDRGPTPALANQILYYDNLNPAGAGIYQVTEGSTSAGTPVISTATCDFIYGVRWLPDGSGLLFSYHPCLSPYGNILEYDFASQRFTQLTPFSNNQYAGYLSVSPDGTWIVFEYSPIDPAANQNLAPDLWMMPRDGSAPPRLFVPNGRYLSWSRSWVPPKYKVYLPDILR